MIRNIVICHKKKKNEKRFQIFAFQRIYGSPIEHYYSGGGDREISYRTCRVNIYIENNDDGLEEWPLSRFRRSSRGCE